MDGMNDDSDGLFLLRKRASTDLIGWGPNHGKK